MKVVTVATGAEGYFPALVEGCERHKLDLQVLGWGQEWKGFSWRWTLLEDYLNSLSPDELVVWTDAYDVIPLQGPHVIAERFAAFGKPIVFSVEPSDDAVSPIVAYARWRQFGACPTKDHLNGGLYMGLAGHLREMIRVLRTKVQFKDADDDQRLLHKLCGMDFFAKHCAVDSQSTLFFNSGNMTEYPETGMDTCFAHGFMNADMSRVLEAHGYAHSVAPKRDGVVYSWKVLKHQGPTFLPEAVACCAVLGMVYLAVRKLKAYF